MLVSVVSLLVGLPSACGFGAARRLPAVARGRVAVEGVRYHGLGSEKVFENINVLGFFTRSMAAMEGVLSMDRGMLWHEVKRAVQIEDLVAILLFNACIDPLLRFGFRLRRDEATTFEKSIFGVVRPALKLFGGALAFLYAMDVSYVCCSIAGMSLSWRVPQIVAGLAYTAVGGVLLTSLKDDVLNKYVLPPGSVSRADHFVLKRGSSIFLWLVCSLVCFEVLRFNVGLTLGSIFSFAGISGLAIGFATKDLISNWVGGALLFLTRPFVPGDKIMLSNLQKSVVESIGWYATLVRGDDNTLQTVPNSNFISHKVSNLSKRKHR